MYVVLTYVPGNSISFTKCGLKALPPIPYELKNSANCLKYKYSDLCTYINLLMLYLHIHYIHT